MLKLSFNHLNFLSPKHQEEDQASPEMLLGFCILEDRRLLYFVEFSDHSIRIINFINLISIDETMVVPCVVLLLEYILRNRV